MDSIEDMVKGLKNEDSIKNNSAFKGNLVEKYLILFKISIVALLPFHSRYTQ